MRNLSWKKIPWWKLGSGYLLFIFLHQSYQLFGEGTLGAILGERFESIYPHIKMYFYAYLAVSAIDYFTHRRQIPSTSSFWNARMLVASSFPWMSIVIWFIPVALGFELGRLELFYSLVLTAIGFYLAFRMEEGLEQVEFRPASQAMVWLAFVAALITYIGFSFHVPENFFITPG